MKQFFKFMFASMLGFFLSIFILGFIGFMFIMMSVSFLSVQPEVDVRPNSVLEIKLDRPIPERTGYMNDSGFLFPEFKKVLGLNDIIECIQSAKHDKDIKGIFINLGMITYGDFTTLDAIRKELIDFKESGKFIVAHGNDISQSGFFLACAADEIYMTPTGSFDLRGFSAELMFLKGTLEKLKIEPQIFRAGKFKSAVEPLTNAKMSDENKIQYEELLTSVYKYFLNEISTSRGVEVAILDSLAKNYGIRSNEDAVKFGLVDSLLYKDEVTELIKDKIGRKNTARLVTLKDYSYSTTGNSNSSGSKIVVIYATGEIHEGIGDEYSIGAENIVKALRQAGDNSSVKAIVMRVNSPGGSALTSDLIWREVTNAKKKKPVVVSMGSVAASGGYYISCAADYIVAEPATLTGSIGVFGIALNMQNFYKDLLGITFDEVKTGDFAGMGSTTRPYTAEEISIVMKRIQFIYDTFVNRVASHRNMTYEQVDSIAQGRVWTGIDAKEIGLVDELGGLDVAVQKAAEKAGITKYRIVEYPGIRTAFEKIMNALSEDLESTYLQFKLGDNYKYYKELEKVIHLNGIQTRMLFDIYIN
ncbi:MAG: signal peptide peptidase SppA [bacterium]